MPNVLSAVAPAVALTLATGLAACAAPPSGPLDLSWRCPAVIDAARRVGWPEPRLSWVDRIAWRESRCRPDAWSPTRDAGAMQIHHRWIGWGLCRTGIACRVEDLFDLDVNLRAAAYVDSVQGPQAWVTSG